MNRRTFLETAVAATAAVATSGCAGFPSSGPILDTHTHFYDPRRPGGLAWPPKDDPLLHRPVLPAEFEKIARPLGIAGTVIVEASPDEADNDWVLGLFPGTPFLRGLVGHLKPGSPRFADHLGRLRRNPAFRGIRTGGWDGPLDAGRPGFLADCRKLHEAGLVLEVLIGPDRLAEVDTIARSIPGVRIVIDHCANLRIDGKEPPADWLRGMERSAQHPGVHCKVSGLVEGSGRADGTAPADAGFYAPVLDALWERFGETRLIFGSNWPVSARFAPLERVVHIASDYFRQRGRNALARCLRTNAETVYGVRTVPG